MKYQIEKGIPIPPNGAGRPLKYPWREMEIGDSFVMDRPTRSASAVARVYGKRFGKAFKTRKIDAKHARVWRVE